MMPVVNACRCGGAWTRCKSNTGDFDSFDDFASKEKDTRCRFADQISSGITDGVKELQRVLKQQLEPVTAIIKSLTTLGNTGLPDSALGFLEQVYPLSTCKFGGRLTGGIGGSKEVACSGAATNFKCKSAK
jgi:hypothetical protein